jgi:hypothetical protein
MFERGREENHPPGTGASPPGNASPLVYDDGYDPAQRGAMPLSPHEVTDETVLALSDDTREYRPWILQRGRNRPALMLHIRRFDSRAAHWMGWQVNYAHLAAIEYVGDAVLSLDFGARQFMFEGRGFGELINHLQSGTVLCIQQYAASVWPALTAGPAIASIKLVAQASP